MILLTAIGTMYFMTLDAGWLSSNTKYNRILWYQYSFININTSLPDQIRWILVLPDNIYCTMYCLKMLLLWFARKKNELRYILPLGSMNWVHVSGHGFWSYQNGDEEQPPPLTIIAYFHIYHIRYLDCPRTQFEYMPLHPKRKVWKGYI
jgi:hypothetical protein